MVLNNKNIKFSIQHEIVYQYLKVLTGFSEMAGMQVLVEDIQKSYCYPLGCKVTQGKTIMTSENLHKVKNTAHQRLGTQD